jgi:N-acetylmuramoyl-L-alanine amidase
MDIILFKMVAPVLSMLVATPLFMQDDVTPIPVAIHAEKAGTTLEKDEYEPRYTIELSDDEKDLLARLVQAEAVGESYEGKVAVAIVVLNRVDCDCFPDTVRDVIYQHKQFSPVMNGSIHKEAGTVSIQAVEEALRIDRSKEEALYFYNPALVSTSWLETRTYIKTIGNHTFLK